MSTVGFDISFAKSSYGDYIFNIVTPRGQEVEQGLVVAINMLGAVMRQETGATGQVNLRSVNTSVDVITGYTYIAHQLLSTMGPLGNDITGRTVDSSITANNISLRVRYNTVRYNYPTLHMEPSWLSIVDLRNFALAGYFLYLKQALSVQGRNFKFTEANIRDQLTKLISSGLVLATNSEDYQLSEFLRNHVTGI